ncbi:hypothetical protein OJF2_56110 [Aquisphaera giovannonii]|uniref:Uncharacterized protein n=1 Tax=Aquisphaera giovannonii TaxID=406548 RepID=A0A5B9W8R7_9BACT|nr:hypothetical protein [Aquisphaera giovannonii]QEH37026.1 hypothetical protein OJF2_56110 [Aquisphaera giovannonii]
MLAELAMAAVMLMIALALVVKVVGWVGSERRGVERREWAVQEASNLLETITARPFDAVTAEAAAKVALSQQARQVLPGVELKTMIQAEGAAGGPKSKRVSVVIRWRDRSGGWDAPVRLSTWIFAGRQRP